MGMPGFDYSVLVIFNHDEEANPLDEENAAPHDIP